MNLFSLSVVIVLTLAAGFADAQGFLHSTHIWTKAGFGWSAAWRSALGFSLSIPCYWIAVRYLQDAGIITPEVQTIFWFAVTISGVAIASGSFLNWNILDKGVGIFILMGAVWLMIRTGA